MVDYNFINVHRRDDCGILCAFKNCGCNYFAPGIGAKYCNPRVCMSVCLSLHSHISKATCPNFTKLSAHVIYNHGSVLRRPQCNALPTSGLWMTSCFYIYGHLDRIKDDVMFRRVRQVAALGQNLMSMIALFVDCDTNMRESLHFS